jgi:phage shock protein E
MQHSNIYTLDKSAISNIKSGKAYLIDVRSASELLQQNCSYAHHWDLQRIIAGDYPNLDKKVPLYVFCRSGNRSSMARQLLLSQGHTSVHNVGGIHDLPAELFDTTKD